jgi:hypothetical protein
MDATSTQATVIRAGRQANRSTVLRWTVRLGLVAYGVVHLLIAWLALQLGWGHADSEASGSGALHELAQQPFGRGLLWAVGVGFAALVVWQLIEASVGHTDQEGLRRTVERIASLGRAAVYAVLGLLAVRVAVGAGTGGGSGEETLTARLLGMPGGQLLVGLVAAGVVGVGIGLVYRGVSGSFLDHLSPRGRSGELGRAVTWLGRAGYGGKGIAICLVGALFAWAAVTFDPDKAGGLDEALATLARQPLGPVLLSVIAVGIGCYGVFCFVRARHLKD